MNGAFLVVVLIAVLALASAWRSAGKVRRWREAHRSERMAHRRTKIILRMEEDRSDAYLHETLRLRKQIDQTLALVILNRGSRPAPEVFSLDALQEKFFEGQDRYMLRGTRDWPTKPRNG